MYFREPALDKRRKVNKIENPEIRFLMLVKLINNEISYLGKSAEEFEEYNRLISNQLLGVINENDRLDDVKNITTYNNATDFSF